MTFLFALLAAVGGYSLLLAWQNHNRGAQGIPYRPTRLPAEPGLVRPLPRVNPTIEAALGTDVSPRRGSGIVVIVEGPAPVDRPLGVAILDARDGRPVAFREVDPRELPARLVLSGLPAGEHLVSLARSAASARHGYLDRAPILVSPASSAQAMLSARVQDVRIQLIDSGGHGSLHTAHTLHELSRLDDDSWRPLSSVPSSATEIPMLLSDDRGLLHLRDLGPGTYVLELSELDLQGGGNEVRFQVPGPEHLDVNCRSR